MDEKAQSRHAAEHRRSLAKQAAEGDADAGRAMLPHAMAAMQRWLAAVLIAGAGCAALAADRRADALEVVDLEVEYDLIARAGLTDAQIQDAERDAYPRADADCTGHGYEGYFAAMSRAVQAMHESGSAVYAASLLVDAARLHEGRVLACLRRLGFDGNAYVVTSSGARMSFVEHAQAQATLVQQIAAEAAARTLVWPWSFVPQYGCGSRGGPGYRLRSGKCASW